MMARGQESPAFEVLSQGPAGTNAGAEAQRKMFIAFADLCTGCRLCEMMCALKHTGVFNPYRAAIKITRLHEEELYVPNICRHCKNPPACQRACPVDAISTDLKTQVAVLDHSKCIKCLNCVYACPFGAIPVGPDGQVYKCDLCGGDPICVKYCPKAPANSTPYHPYPRASCLQYVDHNEVTLIRRLVDVERKTKEGAGAG